jgi:hypothetical protein
LGVGILHAVAKPPRFPCPLCVLWSDNIDEGITRVASPALGAVVQSVEDEQENIGYFLKEMGAS